MSRTVLRARPGCSTKVAPPLPTRRKRWVSGDELFAGAFRLACRVYRSGYRPDVILSLWRGGAPIGLAVDEFFRYHGLEVRHTVLEVKSYHGMERRTAPVVEDMSRLLRQIPRGGRVLIVDDIVDSGSTVAAIRQRLARRTRHVRVAALFFKPEAVGDEASTPDYFIYRTRCWVVFPHELADLTDRELPRKGPLPASLIEPARPRPRAAREKEPSLCKAGRGRER